MSSPTLTGNVRSVSGGDFSLVAVQIESANAAIFIANGQVVAAGKIVVRAEINGDFPAELYLAPGDYRVTINSDSRNSCLIRMPNDEDAHNIVDIIISDVSSPGSGGGSGGSTPVATSLVGGKVKTDVTSGDPVVYLKDTIDTLLAAITSGGAYPVANRAALKAIVSTAIAARSVAIFGPASTDGRGAWWDATDSRADNGGTIIQPANAPTLGRWEIYF